MLNNDLKFFFFFPTALDERLPWFAMFENEYLGSMGGQGFWQLCSCYLLWHVTLTNTFFMNIQGFNCFFLVMNNYPIMDDLIEVV